MNVASLHTSVLEDKFVTKVPLANIMSFQVPINPLNVDHTFVAFESSGKQWIVNVTVSESVSVFVASTPYDSCSFSVTIKLVNNTTASRSIQHSFDSSMATPKGYNCFTTISKLKSGSGFIKNNQLLFCVTIHRLHDENVPQATRIPESDRIKKLEADNQKLTEDLSNKNTQIKQMVAGNCRISHSLPKLLSTGKMSDQRLIFKGKSYHSHRAILSLFSGYFELCFSHNFVDSKEHEYDLSEDLPVSNEIFEIVLKYLYGEEVLLDVENCYEVMYCARFLKISCLLRKCVQKFEQNLHFSEWLISTLLKAQEHGDHQIFRELTSQVDGDMENYLEKLLPKVHDFQSLSPLVLNKKILQLLVKIECSNPMFTEWLVRSLVKSYLETKSDWTVDDFDHILNSISESALTPFKWKSLIVDQLAQDPELKNTISVFFVHKIVPLLSWDS
ncbi:hypothetical protein P9112_000251 [Eukaryota sp. TZLM1-RC]